MKMRYMVVAVLFLLCCFEVDVRAQGKWPANAPTPDQMRELFFQIQNGQITKEQLAVFLHRDEAPTNYAAARRILGDDFIAPEEITTAMNLPYTFEQLEALTKTLPSQETMALLRERQYVLMPGPPRHMGLLDVRTLVPHLFFSKAGVYGASFTHEDRVSAGWLAIRKYPAPYSIGKPWEEQRALLSDAERVPNAGELSWCMVAFQKVRGTRLFGSGYVRTFSQGSVSGRIVHLGNFGGYGIHVFDWPAAGVLPDLGLAAAYTLRMQTETTCFGCR